MIFAYRDTSKWGERLVQAGKKLGVDVCLFNESNEVPSKGDHAVFVHMNHRPEFRENNKRMMHELSEKEVTLIPTLLEAQLYDDKIAQYKLLYEHMPKSYIIQSVKEAEDALNELNFPFISKASTGAGSSNVRLIHNKLAAREEIKLAFGEGIPLHFGQKQVDYLFWQHFYEGNDCTWRVTIIANKYVCISRRNNRDDLPFPTGDVEAINTLNSFTKKLMDKAYSITKNHNFILCAMDFIKDKNEPILLEISVGWPMKKYTNSVFFQPKGKGWEPSIYTNGDFFDLVIKAITNKEFH